MKLIFFIALISTLFLCASCGHIYSQPTEISPQNALSANSFTFYFMLETNLVVGDNLYIKFPFDATATSASISAAFTGSVVAGSAATVSNSYFYAISASIPANTWYQAVVTISTSSMANQAAGVAGCVRFATTSATSGDYIIYDENRCFDVLSFAPAVNTQDFTVTGYRLVSASNYLNPGTTYGLNFDVLPNEDVAGGATYIFTIAGSNFNFVTPCTSVACVIPLTGQLDTADPCPSNFSALSAGQFTCTVASNVLTYVVNTNVFAGNYTRFQVMVQAPNKYVGTATSVSVQFRSRNAPVIFSTATVVAGTTYGIDLKTDLSSVTGSLVVNLFWGLTPTTITSRQGAFTGCPRNLYISNAVRIFNTFKSIFTPATQITAYAGNTNLKAIWTITSTTSLIDQLVRTSLSTNLPGTLSFTFTNLAVTITGVTSLSGLAAYYIGIKFSILETTAVAATAIATQTAANTLTWGGVSIQTVAEDKVVGTFSAVSVQMRKSMDYANDYSATLVYGTQAFTYWSESSAASPDFSTAAAAHTAFQNIITGTTSTTASSSGVWAKPSPISTSKVQALLIEVKYAASAVCVAGGETDYAGAFDFSIVGGASPATTLLCTATTPSVIGDTLGPEIRVLLKLAFNNKVLKITTPEGAYGKRVGGLFLSPDVVAFATTVKTISDSNRLENTISGDASTGLYYLSILCKDVALADHTTTNPVNELCFSADSDNSASFSGVALINTNIGSYPTPYADSNVLDFLLCFKMSPYSLTTQDETLATMKLVEEGCSGVAADPCTPSAGPSMINSYVVTGTVNYDSNIGPMFSIVNGYIQAAGSGIVADAVLTKFIPAYLRVSFAGPSSIPSGSSMLGVFLNGGNLDTATPPSADFATGLLTYADSSSGSVNIIDTIAGSANTATVMRGINALTSVDDTVRDLWFVQDCIVIPVALSTSTFSFYIPVQVSFISLTSIHVVGLGAKTNQAYAVSSVYRVAGSTLSNLFISTPEGSSTTTSNLVYTYTTTAVAFAHVLTDVSNSLTITVTVGTDMGISAVALDATSCFGAVSGTAPTQPGFSGATAFRPHALQTNAVVINTNVVVPAGSTCLLSTGNTGSNWGQAFIVYMRDASPFLTSANTLTWGMAGSDTVTNKCIYHNIKGSSSTPAMIYTIFCTADVHTGITSYSASTITIPANNFRVPFYWGESYAIRQKLNYAWSNQAGHIVGFNGDPTVTSSWKYTDCTISPQLAISYASYDVSITITITTENSVIYTLAAGDYVTLGLSLGGWGVTVYPVCKLINGNSAITCSSSNSQILLTNSGTTSVTLGSPISVSTWVDTNTIAAAETASTDITITTKLNGGSLIESCTTTSSGGGGYMAAGTVLSNSANIQVNSFSYLNSLGARGAFSFSFSYSRLVRAGYIFSLDLGGWMNPTAASTNYRCMVLDGSTVSHQWTTVSPIDTATGVSNLLVKTEYGNGGTWTFKCLGGNTFDGSLTLSDTANQMSAVLRRSSTAAISNETLTFTGPTPSNSAPTSLSVSLTKTLVTSGFDSDYSFSFIPTNNYTTSARFIVEFSQAIPPRLNAPGIAECYVNSTPAQCTFNEERRVVVWTTMALSSVATYPYVVKIAAVTQPNYMNDWDTNKNIWFAIDSDDNLNGGVTEAGFVAETVNEAAAATIDSVFIHSFSITSNKFRSSTSFSYVINLPANSLTSGDTPIWILFPSSIRKFLFYGGSPSITFIRVGDSTSLNLVTKIEVHTGGRVAFRVAADATNTQARNYTLNIGGVTTPTQGTNGRETFRIYLSSDNVTVSTSTAAGSRNTSTYINWDASGFSSQYTLNWADASMNSLTATPARIMLGTYQLLYLIAQGNIFKNTFDFSISSGSNSSSFVARPKDPNYNIRAVTGTAAAPVYLGATTGSAQGRYFINWAQTDSSGQYSSIPTLDVAVSAQNCTPSISGSTFDVPFGGGVSDPLIIDFSGCIPLSDVTVNGNVTSGFNLSETTRGVSFAGSQTSSASLTYTDMSANYKIYFYVSSNSASNGTSALSSAATISFTMGGTNGANINAPSSITINLVVANLNAPVTTTPSVTNSILSVGCDQNGQNYFAVGTNTNAASYDVASIMAATETVKTALTSVDPADPFYISLGYVVGVKAGSLSTVSLSGHLKATANMTVYSYCRSNSLIATSAPGIYNFTQPDNGGQTVVLTAKFNSPISSAQKLALACAIVKSLAVQSRFVKTDEATHCTTLRLLQSNTTNTTNTTTNTTNNTNTSTVVNATYSTNFYVLKNYLASFDNTSVSIIASAAQATYLSSLISSLNDATFPTLASTLFTVTPLILTSANASAVPVVEASNPVIDSMSINVTFNLTNINGLVYAGILAVPESAEIALPNNTRLIQGYDGNNTMLTSVQYVMLSAGGAATINFTNLVNSTNYTIYYAASNLDVSADALYSQVAFTFAVTSAPPSSFGDIIKISMLLMGALFLGLFGMI